jgi:ornithine carbamoyltransferase
MWETATTCVIPFSSLRAVGAEIRVATPKGYEPDSGIVAEARRVAAGSGGKIELFASAEEAVRARKPSTPTSGPAWVRSRKRRRARRFSLLSGEFPASGEAASKEAVFLHCLPAHRGAEVTDEVMDSRARWCSTRRKIACTCRKPFCDVTQR